MKPFLTVISLLISLQGISQNLVLNPGLDNYITCPGFGQFSSTYVTSWSKPSIASSDYYHFTCPGIQPSLQFPRSGEGYAGIIAYNFGQEYREYITGTLTTPLQAGQSYDVEFWVSLHNGYIQAVHELGAYLSVTPPGPFPNILHINVQPQIENTSSALNDTANWRRVWGTFVATGGEQYITIGNFRSDSLTTVTQPGTSGSFGAYYFIDDVSVTPDSSTSIQDLNNHSNWIVWYSSGALHLKGLLSDDFKATEVKVTDMTGKVCAVFSCSQQECQENIHLRNGIYWIGNSLSRGRKLFVYE